jgi:hypothetical protein
MKTDFRRKRDRAIESGRCPSCSASVVNGVYCHEAGCPDSHLFVKGECPWCGQMFQAEEKGQKFCSVECAESCQS